MKKITSILMDHKAALLFALLLAVIVVYPQIYLRYDLGNGYQGIELMGASDDEKNWLSRLREVQDGHLSMSNPFFKDGKDDPYFFQPLGSIMVAYLGKLFSLDINNTLLVFRFFFAFVVFLILYSFLFFFTKERLVALSASLVFFLARSLFSRRGIWQLLSGQSPSTTFLDLDRPVNPALTWFFFFSFLLFFWLFLERKQWRFGILSALTLGLSFYDFFPTWTFIYVFCGLLGVIFFFQKRRPDIKKIAFVILLSALLAIPYFINLYQLTNHPNYAELASRAGILQSRAPVLGFLVPLLFVIFLLFFPRQWRERYLFALALVITPFIVLNQQFLTAKNLAGGVYYHWYFNIPLAMTFLTVIFFSWFSQAKWQFFKRTSAILMIIFSILFGVFVQNSSYAANKEEIMERQKYGKVMDWLNENGSKEEVVLSDNETARLIVIYTPLNVFYHGTANRTLAASHERLLDILFSYYRLDGVGEEEAREVFFKDRKKISSTLYGIYYRNITGTYEGIPDELIEEFTQKYLELSGVPTDNFLNGLWSKYQVKYLVWDTKLNPQWQLDRYPFLEKAVQIGDFIIYRKD